MKVIYKKSVFEKAIEAVNAAAKDGKIIEKFVLDKNEQVEMRVFHATNYMSPFVKWQTIYGIPVEFE